MNMLWSKKIANHLFVFWRGQLIYKNYDSGEPSWLLNDKWPHAVKVIDNKRKSDEEFAGSLVNDKQEKR